MNNLLDPTNMFRKFFIVATTLFLLTIGLHAQVIEKSAPAGFDSLRAGIPNGKFDTITYESKTVGTKRRALICWCKRFS